MVAVQSACLGSRAGAAPRKWRKGRARGSAAQAVGRTPDGALEVTLALQRADADAAATLTVEAVWQKPAWVHLAAIELDLPGDRAQVMGRELRPQRVQVARLERFDPKWIT